ncbi:MAG: hypothetical protein GX967_05560 [Clostridiales bacterium]|nr:hypothetical protein [Clostridiales bacterium]
MAKSSNDKNSKKTKKVKVVLEGNNTVKVNTKPITPLYSTNPITQSKTLPDGNVENISEDNADLARRRVDNIRL